MTNRENNIIPAEEQSETQAIMVKEENQTQQSENLGNEKSNTTNSKDIQPKTGDIINVTELLKGANTPEEIHIVIMDKLNSHVNKKGLFNVLVVVSVIMIAGCIYLAIKGQNWWFGVLAVLILALAIFAYNKLYYKNVYTPSKEMLLMEMELAKKLKEEIENKVKYILAEKEDLLEEVEELLEDTKTVEEGLPTFGSYVNGIKFTQIKQIIDKGSTLINKKNRLVEADQAYPAVFNNVKEATSDILVGADTSYEDKKNISNLNYKKYYKLIDILEGIEDTKSALEEINISVEIKDEKNVNNFINYIYAILIKQLPVFKDAITYNKLVNALERRMQGEIELKEIGYRSINLNKSNVERILSWKNIDNITIYLAEMIELFDRYLASDDTFSLIEELKDQLRRYYAKMITIIDRISELFTSLDEEASEEALNLVKELKNELSDWFRFDTQFSKLLEKAKKYNIYGIVVDKDLFLNVDRALELLENVENDKNGVISLKNMHWNEVKALTMNKDLIDRVIKQVNDFRSYVQENTQRFREFEALANRFLSDIQDIDVVVLSQDFASKISLIRKNINEIERAIAELTSFASNSPDYYGANEKQRVKSILNKYGFGDYYNNPVDPRDVKRIIREIEKVLEKYTDILSTLEIAREKAQRIKSLQNADIDKKIHRLSEEFFNAQDIINSFSSVRTSSADSVIEYLKDYEQRIYNNNFKSILESLNQLTNALGGPAGILKDLDQIELGKQLYYKIGQN